MKKLSLEGFTIPIGIGLGLIASWVVTVGGCSLCAWIINNEKVGEGSLALIATIILILASAIGALVGSVYVKKLKLPICLACGCGYYLSLLGITALLFDGQYQGLLVGIIGILAGCVPIAFLPSKKNRVGKWRKKTYR